MFGKLHVAPEGQEELGEETAQRLGFDNYHIAPNDTAGALAETVRDFLRNNEIDSSLYLEINFQQPHRIFGLPFLPFTRPDVEPSDAPVSVPAYLPDNEATRDELADLQAAIGQIDSAVNTIFDTLDSVDRLGDNTLSIFTSDQGIAMPRSKPTVFEPGIEIPIIAHWPAGGLDGGKYSPN